MTRDKNSFYYETNQNIFKEVIKMKKDCVKYAAVGVAGYFIGFYEMKYKVMKTMLDTYLSEAKASENEEKGGEEES